MKVKLKESSKSEFQEAKDFTLGKEYLVLAIECNEYLLIPDKRGVYLYNPEIFEIIDPERPSDWITRVEIEDNNSYEYSYPMEFCIPNFFNDYFKNKPEAVQVFNSYIEPYGLRAPKIINLNGKVVPNETQ